MPAELHWYAHANGWRPKPLMLKAQAQTIFLIHKLLKMQTQKMSLANIKGKLSRAEMKNIKAGVEENNSGGICGGGCSGSVGDWDYLNPGGVVLDVCSADILDYCSSRRGYCNEC
jgi:hypothetical protein